MFEIIALTLFVNLTSTIIATILGVFLGYLLFHSNSRFKNIFVVFNRTMMSLPPVVLGLLVYIVFSRNGTLAWLQWLYTVNILIVTQVLLVTPIICGHFYDLLENEGKDIMYYLQVLGANKRQQFWNMLLEEKANMIIIFTVGFSRAVSEVGAIMITGGNIKGKTRMMTTSISMLQSQGEIQQAINLGIVLLVIAFGIQYVLNYFKGNR